MMFLVLAMVVALLPGDSIGDKPGKCLKIVTPFPLPPCARPFDRCFSDDQCPGTLKCCRPFFCAGYKCMPPVTVPKPGKCPVFVIPNPRPMCKLPNPKCEDDADCPGNEKCCRRDICGGMECGPPAPEEEPCICKYGPPQCNMWGEPVLCGPSTNIQNCAPGYNCNIRSFDPYGICCPVGFENTSGIAMILIVLVMVVALLPAPGDFKVLLHQTCPHRCPYGMFATIVTNSDRVDVCVCKNPCEGLDCPRGKTCLMYTVHCYQPPCPPRAKCVKAPMCKHGLPKFDKLGKQMDCGPHSLNRQGCGKGYECIFHPKEQYRVCCPASRSHISGRCPFGQVWKECGSACTATCIQPNPICIMVCVRKCECPRHRHILHCGRCIRWAQCPRRRR